MLPAVASPPPPPRSRWHDWWKFPLFFGVLAGALVLMAYLGLGGLLLLLLVYAVVRGVLVGKRRKAPKPGKPEKQ